jgi:hypothetical protein
VDLRSEIEMAFAEVPQPSPDALVIPTYDDEGISTFFRGKNWRTPTVEELRRHEVALSLLSAEAFRYYLPAFMLAELEEPDKADLIGPGIIFHFSKPAPYWVSELRRRLSLLTGKEKAAIRRFITERGPHCCDEAQIREALEILEHGI